MPTDDFARTDETESPARSAAPTQDPYLAFALRWWWLLIIGGILGLGGGFAYARYGPIPYTSVAQVQVPPQTTTNPNANSGQAADATANYSTEATTSQMFTLVSQELAGTLDISASELLIMQQQGELVIKPVKGTNFITITVTGSDRERARLLADTIAVVFVRAVNDRAAALIDARQQLLEGQIDLTGQRYLTSRLNQRQDELHKELTDQRAILLQLQSSYQQEMQRQAEFDKLNGTPSAEINATRARWLDTLNSQISDVERGLRDIQAQIDLVQGQLATLPGSSDPSVSAAFATAYGQQLQLLTRDYAQLELDAPAARAPLVRYGVASDPLPASGLKKMLLMGGVLGGMLAAALGFGIDFLRRRKATATAAETTAAAPATAATATVIAPPQPREPEVAAAPVVAINGAHPIAAAAEPAETPPAGKSEDLIFLIERARQRRKGADEPDAHGLNGAAHGGGATPRHRPLPTQDDDFPLRRVGP